MKKQFLLTRMLLLCALIIGSVSSAWGDSDVLFHETFGNNSGSARDWKDSYSVKSGVSDVYSNITGYTITNAKQGKNTTGSTQSGLNQSSQGTDASIIIGPLNVADYNTLKLTYQWKAASIKGTYSTKAYYATSSGGEYTEVSGTGNGATTFVERAYSLPAAAQVSTLYLKIVFNTSNTQAIIDEVELTGIENGSGGTAVAAPAFSVAGGEIAAGTTITLSTETVGADIYYTLDGTTPSSSSKKYTTGITVTKPVTITAIAIDDSEEESAVSSATYTIRVETPTFSEKAGKVDEGTILTITASPSLTIIYTIDGSTPSWESSNGEIYSEPLVLNDPVTVKAVAVDDYENESSVNSASYTISYDGGVDIIPNFTFFGKNASYSGTDYSEVSGTQDGVTVTHSKGTGENTYASASAMRFYQGNTLTIEAPAGKVITKIVLIQSNAETDNISSSPLEYNQTNHTWAGKAESVVFTRPKAGSYMQFTQISVVLANKVTLASACTDGSKFYGTYSSSKALKVPADLTISEIKVEDEKLVVVPYATGEVIPANTGVMIASTTSGEHTIAIAKDDAGTSKLGVENMLKASGDEGIDAATMNEENKLFYRLTMHEGTIGFYWGAAEGAAFLIAANKAYLAVPKDAAARIAGFNLFENEGEATAIEGVKTIGMDAPVFNLNGQRVNGNAKGLLIKNGKKFMNR